MIKIKYIIYLSIILWYFIPWNDISAQSTDHGGADWTPGSGTVGGRHYNIGTFTLNAGYQLTVDANSHYLQIEAVNIVIAGTISGNGAGSTGGSGGSGGAWAFGNLNGCNGGYGGYGGSAGGGTGGGNPGFTGGPGDCQQQICGGLFCSGDRDGFTAGGGGGGGGSGGSYGGAGGIGGVSAYGQSWTGGVNGGSYASGGSTSSIFGTNCGTDISWGSGGGGAGGGGGAYMAGLAGGSGGNGGGMVRLISSNNLTISGNIICNGTNGSAGGDAGGQSIGNDWDCNIQIGGFWGGSGDGYNGCDVCSYYNHDASAGAGGGGSGGSGGGIMIECNGTLNLTGILSVEGGDGGVAGLPNPNNGACNDWAQGGAGGGGGRIKIFRNPCLYHVISPSSSFSGGFGGAAYVNGNNGQTGTVCNDNISSYIPLAGGTLILTDPSFCVSGNVPLISATNATGGLPGNYLYQWQYSILGTGGPWQDILAANQTTYDPGVITQTTWFRRQVTSMNCIEYTNVVIATVHQIPGIGITQIYAPQCAASTTFTLTGGTPTGGTYSGPGVSGGNFNASVAGPGIHTITYTFTDVNGCTGSDTRPIIVDANPVGIITGLSPVCAFSTQDYSNTGNTFMAISWVISGGTIASGQGTESIRVNWGGGPTGTLSFTGQDGFGCSTLSAATTTVNINPLPVITLVPLDSICISEPAFVLTNGSPAGGTYTGPGVTGGSFNPAAAGPGVHTITYTYTDINSCTNSATVTIKVLAIPSLTFPAMNPVCTNTTPFTLNAASPAGGTYTGTGISGNIFNPAVAGVGTYTITYDYTSPVTGCSNVITSTITVNPVPVPDAGRDTLICYGAGVILTAGGAGVNGTYLWDDASTNPVRTITSLTTGTTFSVTVTNTYGCSASDMVSVFVNPQMTVSISASNVTCNGFSNGSATANVTGGAFPYAYHWSDNQTTNPAVNLVAGTYSVTVTEASYIHCNVTGSITIIQPNAVLSIAVDSSNVSCFGLNDGSINITVSGGTPQYSYLWSNSNNNATLNNLFANLYTVTVTDIQQCRLIRSVNITQPNLLRINFDSSAISCNGANDGRITAIISGGTLPYTYIWNTGDSTPTISNLVPGTYTVTVTDNHQCITSRAIVMNEPAVLQLNITTQHVSCFGFTDGSATANVTGGTIQYSYSWSNNVYTATIANQPAGTYFVTITDAHNCIATGSTDITQPPLLTLSIDSANVLCNGGNTGSINTTPGGGTLPYSFIWSDGSISEDLTNLVAGIYTVTFTDAHSCEIIRPVIITEPLLLTVNLLAIDETCLDYCNGEIIATTNGGTSPYIYLWDSEPPQVNSSAIDLCVGSYTITVTDNNQCKVVSSATVATRTIVQASYITAPPGGTVPVEIGFSYTGTLASTWSWNFGDGGTSNEVNPSHYYRRDSVYDVRLTVNSGYPDFCTDTYVSQVVIYPVSTIFVPSAFTPNNDNVNDRFEVKGHAIRSIDVYIFNRWGQQVYEFHNMDGYWDGYVDGELAPTGVYIYQIRAKGYDDAVYRKVGRVNLFQR